MPVWSKKSRHRSARSQQRPRRGPPDPAVRRLDPALQFRRTVDLAYDATDGYLSAVDDADALGRTTRTTYDSGGNKLSETLAVGTADEAVTSYEYNERGKLTSLTDPDGNVTTWEYDVLGRQSSMTDPLSHTESRAYDDSGRLASILNRNGLLRAFAYDDAGRLATETWYDGPTAEDAVVNTLTWSYTAAGLVASASSDDGAEELTYTYTYNNAGHVTHVVEPFGVELSFGYDPYGNRNIVIDSLGGVERSIYNANGQLLSRTLTQDGETLRLDFTYEPLSPSGRGQGEGQVATITRYSDAEGTSLVATTVYSYDLQGHVTSIASTDAEEDPIDAFDYEYDLAGQLTSQTLNGVTTDFTYNGRGELIGEDDGTTEQDYTYDLEGRCLFPVSIRIDRFLDAVAEGVILELHAQKRRGGAGRRRVLLHRNEPVRG